MIEPNAGDLVVFTSYDYASTSIDFNRWGTGIYLGRQVRTSGHLVYWGARMNPNALMGYVHLVDNEWFKTLKVVSKFEDILNS